MSISDTQARQLLLQAWPTVLPGVTPNLAALQAVQSVGRAEAGYGNAWPGTNNWGAIQRGRPDAAGNCPAGTVAHGDTHANGAGYLACFATYPSPLAGAQALIRAVFKIRGRDQTVLPAALSGDQIAFDTALHDSAYYELGLQGHIESTTKNVAELAAALNEPVALCIGCGSKSPAASGSGSILPAVAGFLAVVGVGLTARALTR